jgi:hypothetical protein
VLKPKSVVSNRLLAGIAKEGGGDVAKAATGDPAPPKPAAAKRAKVATPSRAGKKKAS